MSEKNDLIRGMLLNKNFVYGVVCYNKKPISTETAWKYPENSNVFVRAKNQYEAVAQAKLLVENKEHYEVFSVQEI